MGDVAVKTIVIAYCMGLVVAMPYARTATACTVKECLSKVKGPKGGEDGYDTTPSHHHLLRSEPIVSFFSPDWPAKCGLV